MLFINVSSAANSALGFRDFEDLELPPPPGGIDAEVNGHVALKFEDEDEAVAYAGALEDIANDLDDKDTRQYTAINDIIMAIYNDEFVKSYSR